MFPPREQIVEAYRRETSLFEPYLRKPALKTLEEILEHPGFLGATDPPALALIALLLTVAKPIRVLQIGTLIGYSAVLIADILQQNGRGHLITVDPNEEAHREAHKICSRAGLDDTITFVTDYSTGDETRRVMDAAAPFDFVYLDASHAYAATLQELDLLLQPGGWLDDGGILVLHDPSHAAREYDPTGEGGVRRAIDEWMEANPRVAELFLLEPPFWPAPPGLGFFRRRVPAAPAAGRADGP